MRSHRFVLLACLAAAPLVAGCGSPAPSGPVGGPVTGAADDHCDVAGKLEPQKVGMCIAPHAVDASAADDGGTDDGGAPPEEPFVTLFNSEGYDDDCKYRVSFTSTPIRKNEAVTFTVTVVGLDPAGPATEAELDSEVYLDELTPAPNTNPTTTETGPGVYKVGPIKLDKPGRWTVRFHMYENCSDANVDSPHGHVAFYIDVP